MVYLDNGVAGGIYHTANHSKQPDCPVHTGSHPLFYYSPRGKDEPFWTIALFNALLVFGNVRNNADRKVQAADSGPGQISYDPAGESKKRIDWIFDGGWAWKK